MPQSVDRFVDARGFLCPIPTLRDSLALEEMLPGQVLEVLAGDPSTRRDLAAWCRDSGHTLLGFQDEDSAFRACIRKN